MGTLANNNMRSKHVLLRFFAAGLKEIVTNTMDFTVKEIATEGVDNLNGQLRADPYTVTDYFDIAFNGTQTDNSLLSDFLHNIATKDANNPEDPAVVTVEATTLKGVTNAYTFTGVTRKPFELDVSGRADPFKLSSGWKCKNFKQVA